VPSLVSFWVFFGRFGRLSNKAGRAKPTFTAQTKRAWQLSCRRALY
jgi:hypothetical protein